MIIVVVVVVVVIVIVIVIVVALPTLAGGTNQEHIVGATHT